MKTPQFRFSVVPFLIALFIAPAAMPTDVVAVNAFEMGHEHTQPWRRRSADGVVRMAVSARIHLRAALAALWESPWRAPVLAAAAVLVASFVVPDAGPGVVYAVMGTIGLKDARHAVADVDRRLAENAARASEIDREINTIADTCQQEKRALTAEEDAKLADLRKQKASVSSLRTVLMEQKAAASAALAEAEARNEAERTAPAATDPDAATAAHAHAAAGMRITMGVDRTQLDPKRGFSSHTDQLKAIMKAAETGVVDPRLKPLAAAGGDEQGSHTNPHGGFLLAPAFQPELLSVQAEVDPLAGRVRSFPMTAERVVFNARVDKNHSTSVSGGLTVARTPQTKAAAASRMEFESVELIAHDLCGVGYATNRILQLSPISFLTVLQSGFRDEFAATKIDERLNGDGNMEFEGVINADCTITVAKEAGQEADTIIFENINKMISRCWRYGSESCVWLANHDTRPQLTTLYIPIGTGGVHVPIYSPPDEAAPQGRLMGAPVFFTEFCQKLGDKGDIVLGMWSEFLEGTLVGSEEFASSVHVRFLEREQTFLFVVANAGKPWWRSALTPKYSTVTLSPFVTLAAR